MSAGELDLAESWAPAECTLPTAERPLRVALTATGGQLLLEVVVPPAHIAVLDALAASAATALSGGVHRQRS